VLLEETRKVEAEQDPVGGDMEAGASARPALAHQFTNQ
jgi:hypothetical protein